MSLTTLVTFVELFKIDSNNRRISINRLQNAKRDHNRDVKNSNNTIVI